MKKPVVLAIVLLTACSSINSDYISYLHEQGVEHTAIETFTHCRGYNCRLVDEVTLDDTEWQKLGSLFKKVSNAEEEREAIAKAIGYFETIVGEKTGTSADVAGTYRKLGDYQHDCTDESLNSTLYLHLLREKELLKFHDVALPQSRIPILGGGAGFHKTAVIIETTTGDKYAVDSWFYDNGHVAEIADLGEWFYGWRPEKEN